MNLLSKAVWRGMLTEVGLLGLSVLLAVSGGYGPCGPANWAAQVAEFIQYPGFWIAGRLFWNAPNAVQFAAILLPQVGLWSLVWWVWLRARRNQLAQR